MLRANHPAPLFHDEDAGDQPPALERHHAAVTMSNILEISLTCTTAEQQILFVVNTGFLTSLCAVASLVSILVAGGTFLYIGWLLNTVSVLNSLLANLNARKMIRCAGGVNTSNNVSVSLHDFPRTVNLRRLTDISIEIDGTQGLTLYNSDHNSSKKAESAIFTSAVVGSPLKVEH
ncbi:hypothetical protein BD779DRAFT_1679445 [Infundibulicybe gibba]|nr:hypothetical protein BD779DRAFT_1679445 [Infundibulicybe gibba]